MPSFGTSAFIKLLCLNERPQRTELRRRLLPRVGGYDFHASLRRRAQDYLLEGRDFPAVLKSVEEITRKPEQRYAREGLKILRTWRSENEGRIVRVDPRVYESPRGLFRVRYQPTFGLVTDGGTVAVHLWNTTRPDLIPTMVYRTLALFPDLYDDATAPSDLAVLSLPDRRLFRLTDVDDYSDLAERMAYGIEELMLEAIDDLGLPRPTRPGIEDRP